MGVQLVWLKRDLRLSDHAPLSAAARRGPVLVLYVFEPSLWARPESDASHLRFILESLEEVEVGLHALGGRLIYRMGELPEVFDRLHSELPFETIHAHEETGLGLTYARDRRVAKWCRQNEVTFSEYPQFGVFRPHPRREGWAGRWEAMMRVPMVVPPERITIPERAADLSRGRCPTGEELGLVPSTKVEAQAGGSEAALGLLRSFLQQRGRNYARQLSSPTTAREACSRLSPHLAYGTISMRRIWKSTQRKKASATRRAQRDWVQATSAFDSRLRWHCHFIQKLEDEPELEERNAHRSYDGLRVENPEDWSTEQRRNFEAWRAGRTGFPMVDAAMRCLHRTGWVNFRMRAMLASFACHHLWLHWRAPAVALAPHFLDFEPGIHFSQFQMQAGTTGINSVRIYNVVKQAEEQDPNGDFIRAYVPELAGVPQSYLAAPQHMPLSVQEASGCRVGKDYPKPIVDQGAAVRAARGRLDAIRRGVEAMSESRRVARKHGSRRRVGEAGRSLVAKRPL